MVDKAGSERDHLAYFETWGEYVEAALGKSTIETGRRSSRRRDSDWDPWHGTETWTQAKQLAQGGWAEGWERVAKMGATFARSVNDKVDVPTVEYDVTGDYVDIGAYLAGEPECMGYFTTREVDRPVCHIVLNGIFSSGITTSQIERRGAACLALIDALERSGRRCEVTLSVITGPGNPLEARVTLKRADDQLNPGLLAFALCHPAASRRIGFSWLETLPESVRAGHGVPGNYGRVVDTDQQGDIYFAGALYSEPQWSDDASAEAWVLEQLREQGVVVQDTQ